MNSSGDTAPDRTKRPHGLVQTFKAGAVYFIVVVGTGFMLESIRVLWVAPRFGGRIAELMEMPIMLLATIIAARWVVGRFALPPLPGIRLGVGFVALGLLLIAEFTVVLPLRGLTIDEYFANQDSISEAVDIVTLWVFTVMPFLVAHSWDRDQ